jgi:hypothetical protein
MPFKPTAADKERVLSKLKTPGTALNSTDVLIPSTPINVQGFYLFFIL